MELTVALGQITSSCCNLKGNCERHIEWIHRARSQGAQLIVFPELSLSGYYLREAVSEAAISLDNPIIKQLTAESTIGVIVGFVEKGARKNYFNSALFIEKGNIIGIHRKIYLPTYGMFEEGRYFTPGKNLKTHKTSCGTVGIVICEDAWYPHLVLQFSKMNVNLLVVITASPVKGITRESGIKNIEMNRFLMRLYARNLKVPVLFVNKIGYEHGVYFWGGSAVYTPDGAVQCTASVFSEDLVITHIMVN